MFTYIYSLIHYLDLKKLVIVKLDVIWKHFLRFQTLLVFLILNGTAKTNLANLVLLYCREMMKNSIRVFGEEMF